MPLAELPWWAGGLILPVTVLVLGLAAREMCSIFGRMAARIVESFEDSHTAFLNDLKTERERSYAERARDHAERVAERERFLATIDGFRAELAEHTAISKQMYRAIVKE